MSIASWSPSALPGIRASRKQFDWLFACCEVRDIVRKMLGWLLFRTQSNSMAQISSSRAHNKPLKVIRNRLFFSSVHWFFILEFLFDFIWRQPKSLVACDVVVGTIQPPRATTTQAFRGGLKESNMPMMEFDMTTAFPTLAASAFKPIATTASLIAKVTHEFCSRKVVVTSKVFASRTWNSWTESLPLLCIL